MGQSRRNAEDASGACCSGGGGRKVGQEQQAQARRNPAAFYRIHRIASRKNLTVRGEHASWEILLSRVFARPLTHRIWVIDSSNILLFEPPALQACIPERLGSLRGSAPQRGSRGLAPWPQRSAPPALAWRDGERFGERKRTHRNAWCSSSLRESDTHHDFGPQFWGWSLPIEDLASPSIMEGD